MTAATGGSRPREADATIFAYCPGCRVLWLGTQGDALVHLCAAKDPWISHDPAVADRNVNHGVRIARMRTEVPTQYASRVSGKAGLDV